MPAGWMIAGWESAELAEALIANSCDKHAIAPGQLTLHADRGASMRSKPVADLLAHLGVIKSHSRPYVSDDNPYSESQFNTMNYRPNFPDRFHSIEEARAFCQTFFAWYNYEHRHAGIGYVTPAAMHAGVAGAIYHRRAAVLQNAFTQHPNRFKHRLPRPPIEGRDRCQVDPVVEQTGVHRVGRAVDVFGCVQDIEYLPALHWPQGGVR